MKIFYDVDTQNDFIKADGALSVPGGEVIRENLENLTTYAVKNKIIILGSADRHFGSKEYQVNEIELNKWGGPFPDHCMSGSFGQKKITETTAEKRIFIPSRDFAIDDVIVEEYDQIIFEKQSCNVFFSGDNPGGNGYIDDMLKRLGVKTAVVYGVATDYCVKAVVTELLSRGIAIYVAQDAIAAVDDNNSEKSIFEMKNAGAEFVSTNDVITGTVKGL